MQSFIILFVTFSLLSISFVGAYVFAQRKNDAINNSFLMVVIAAAGWVGFEALSYLPFFLGNEEIPFRLATPFWTSMGIVWLYFSYNLLGSKLDKLFYGLLVITIPAVILSSTTDMVIAGSTSHDFGGLDIRGDYYYHMCTLMGLTSLFGLYLMWKKQRKVVLPHEVRGYKLIMVGGGVAINSIAICNLVLPVFFDIHMFVRIGSSFTALFCYMAYLAVSKYNLFTISVEQQSENLFRRSVDGLILTDPDGNILRMNESATQILDRKLTKAIGKQIEEIFKNYPGEDEFNNKEISIENNNQTKFYSANQFYSYQNKMFVGRTILIRDITASKQYEKLLVSSRNKLENEVEKRSEELLHSQRMDIVGTMAGGIAHNFNNLLTTILGYASIAKTEPSISENIREDMVQIILAAKRGRDLVKQLSTVSRIEQLTAKPVDVYILVKQAIKMVKINVPKNISLNGVVDENIGLTIGDSTQLQQVLMNLINNSVDAIKTNEGTILIKASSLILDADFTLNHSHMKPGKHIKVTISDDGTGISKNNLEKIFDPFFTTKDAGEGTGLGLSTASDIIVSHCGFIDAQSETDKGTDFNIYLPMFDETNNELSADTTGEIQTGSEKILLVDDDISVAKAHRRILEKLGYKVSVVTDSLKAVQLFKNAPDAFDLVVTDLAMPELSGSQLQKIVNDIRADIPVILVSGYIGKMSDKEHCDAKFAAELSKPISQYSIGKAIRSVLDNS